MRPPGLIQGHFRKLHLIHIIFAMEGALTDLRVHNVFHFDCRSFNGRHGQFQLPHMHIDNLQLWRTSFELLVEEDVRMTTTECTPGRAVAELDVKLLEKRPSP